MSNVTFQIPYSLFRSIQELVEHEGYSIDQFHGHAWPPRSWRPGAFTADFTLAARPPVVA